MVGYRHFDTNDVKPEYEFGFGLSYSEFVYSNLTMEGSVLSFDITNTSDTDGKEVAQVYIEYPKESWVNHPRQELKAFAKVMIPAHETKRTSIIMPDDAFTYYNVALKKWIVETGAYKIKVGSSSRNQPLSILKEVKSDELFTTDYELI